MKTDYSNVTVSVIIPVYNAARHLREAIDSVLAQTYPQIELILIDDCSKDNSRLIIENYKMAYPHIVSFFQNENQGVAVTRNLGLRLAKGRYVAFLDSDDIWKPQKIALQIQLMNKKKAALCYSGMEIINENGKPIHQNRKVKEEINYSFLLKNTMIGTSTVVLDRSIIGDFQMPLLRSGQDYASWLLILRNGTLAYGINRSLVKYRKSSQSLSSNKWKSIQQVFQIQVQQEKIPRVVACCNTLCFFMHAVKKHLNETVANMKKDHYK